MRKVSIVIVFMTTLLLSSCNNKLSYKQAIKRSYGQEIDFSWDKRLIMSDSTQIDSSLLQTPIKIISYIDKKLCYECLVKYLYGACALLADYPSDSVKFICIIASRSEDNIRKYLKEFETEACALIYDINDSFIKQNSLERHSAFCRTFLLDSKNTILLTGDPLRQLNLQNLYIEKIDELLSLK